MLGVRFSILIMKAPSAENALISQLDATRGSEEDRSETQSAATALQCHRDSIGLLQSRYASVFGDSFGLKTVKIAERIIVDTILELAGCGLLSLDDLGIGSEDGVSVTDVPWPYIPLPTVLCQGESKGTERSFLETSTDLWHLYAE